MTSNARKLVALLAVAIFSMMSVGSAYAATDSAEVSLSVVCPSPASVELSGDLTLGTIDAYGDQSMTLPGAIDVTVDVGCYLGPWQVNASITNFHGSTGGWINASHFNLVDATTETYFLEPIDFVGVLEPTANDADFSGPADEDAILETQENWIFWWMIESPAPFITTATYTGLLEDLGFTLPGEYEATMTVELTFE